MVSRQPCLALSSGSSEEAFFSKMKIDDSLPCQGERWLSSYMPRAHPLRVRVRIKIFKNLEGDRSRSANDE